MKKNLISVVILALVFANFVLTALLMFSVLPETKKANTLIEKVCSAIDLDLNSGAATGTSNISIDDQEIYKVSEGEDLTTNLAEGKDGPVFTENGNFILDIHLSNIVPDLEQKLKAITGVIESGLFIGYDITVLMANR